MLAITPAFNFANQGGAWKPEQHERLVAHWASGLSAALIAKELNHEFGTSFSRNAVLGRVHRQGVATHSPRRSANPAAKRTQPFFRLKRAKTVWAIAREAPRIDDALIPLGQRKTFIELEPHHCHWPVGDPSKPDFFFCGSEKLGSSPYCASHHRVAHAR